MKKIIYAVLAFVFPFFAYAQDFWTQHLQDVEGVEIDSVMTYAQVVAKFGQPDEVKVEDDYDPHQEGKCRYYKYGENELVFSDNNGLIEYRIYDNRFAVLTKMIDGGLRVGDPLSKVHQNVDSIGPVEKRRTYSDGTNRHVLFPYCDVVLLINEKGGIITAILYSAPL